MRKVTKDYQDLRGRRAARVTEVPRVTQVLEGHQERKVFQVTQDHRDERVLLVLQDRMDIRVTEVLMDWTACLV